MKREIILKATSLVVTAGGAIDPGTAPYPWKNTPFKTLFDTLNSPSPVAGEYAYFWPGSSVDTWAVGYTGGPTLARFTKVTITAGFDYSQAGGPEGPPGPWWFPPDNAAGPGATLMLRKRDLTTWLAGTGTAAYRFLSTDDNNVNINTTGGYKLHTLTWEMTAHPEGGPWTLTDINALAVGCGAGYSLGPNGLAFDPAGHAFHKIRIPYLTVTLEVEDLGGYVDNVRAGSSLVLRLMRRARNAIRPRTLAEHAVGDLFSRVYFEHPRGPAIDGQGWGPRRLEGRSGMVLQRIYYPAAIQIADEVLDMRPIDCLGWAAYRIDGPWSTELQGLALLDKGRGFVHARAQDAWSMRPGDGAIMRVLEGYPAISFEGLPVQGGGDVSIALRNYDLTQSGWSTVASTGTFSAAADTTVAMAEELGYLSSCRLTYGAGGGTGGRERGLGTLPRAAGDRLHARAILKNTSIVDPVTQFGELYLKRSGGGLPAAEFWDEVGRVWTTTPTYIAIPSTAIFGETVLDAVPCDAPGATSDPTYVIGVGRFSSSMGPVTLHGAIVDVQHSDDTVAGARTPLVTLDATITRVVDTHKMDQVWGRDLWVHERGTAVVEVRPFWRAADLPNGAVKPLLHAQHASAGTGAWQALQFVAVTGSDDLIRFEAAIDGEATYQLDCPLTGINLTRLHVLRAWARWLGVDGWTEYGPYSVEVGFAVFLQATGALVGTGSVLGRLASETAVPTARDYLGIGTDETRQLDGWVRMWETRRSPLHRLEAIWRL